MTSNFLLLNPYFRLLTSDFNFLLITSDFLLPTSDFQLLTSNFLLLTSYFLPSTSNYLLPKLEVMKLVVGSDEVRNPSRSSIDISLTPFEEIAFNFLIKIALSIKGSSKVKQVQSNISLKR